MVLRILASIVLLFSVLFMPFWLSVILGLGAMVYFNYFFEAVILFGLSDALYGVREARFHGIVFVSFIASIIFLILLEALKKKLNFYNK
jgi:glucan phosphoethanolaminetransferase (alkaline phosphatase superfamily)